MIFNRWNVKPKDCIFITDTLGDIKEAEIVSIPTIACSWGYQQKSVLKKGDSIAILDKASQISAFVEKTFSQ